LAIAERLRAAGYDVVPIDDSVDRSAPDWQADFAVARCLASELDATIRGDDVTDNTSPALAVGWMRMPAYRTGNADASASAQRDEHVQRIFSAIAPLFLNADQEVARRLAEGLHTLHSMMRGLAYCRRDGSRPASES
jgi:NAD(P)-dependent dehydrogenase (short-subunit alcohol dehydrogenase family)